jgi:hypothetical protein
LIRLNQSHPHSRTSSVSCHSNFVNTGNHLPNISDVKTRKIRNMIGIDMALNKRNRLAWWRTSQSLRPNLLYPVNWCYSVPTVRVRLGLDSFVFVYLQHFKIFQKLQARPMMYSVFFVSWRLKCLAHDFRCLRYYCDNVNIS